MVFDVFGALVFGGGIGGFLAFVGVGYLQTYRNVRRMDPVDIRALGDPTGSVEFEGTAEAHEETFQSPLTDTDCLVHEWRVERYRKSTNGSNWRTRDSGEASTRFLLDGETGAVLIEPGGASIHAEESDTVEVDPDESPPAPVQAYLRETDAVDSDPDHKRRYHESRLEPGDDVYVYGPVRENAHSADIPGPASAVVGLENPDEHRLELGGTSLSDVLDRVRSDGEVDRFLLANDDEASAERTFLNIGLFALAVSLFFLSLPVVVLLT